MPDKRIKRHIIGRARDYFISVPPGFESVCYDELTSLPLSIPSPQIVEGGIEFKGKLQDCQLANLHLRSANRILMRIGEFNASNFNRLMEKISELPWELYIRPDSPLRFIITSKASRLYHQGAIASRLESFFGSDRMDMTEDANPQRIFVRAVSDHFTVSLDSSGEHLHKRGIKPHIRSAPIRETLAAAILKLSGYTASEPLFDPMTGAGTFAIEAAMMALGIPAGWFRNFAFMDWPSFNPKRWDHLKQEAKQSMIQIQKPLIFASDIDPQACKALEDNLGISNLSSAAHVVCKDFFDIAPSEYTDRPGLIVLNPPYGVRMGTESESKTLFSSIFNQLKQAYRNWKFAVICPNKAIASQIPFRAKQHSFLHGGTQRILATGRIPH